MRGSQQSVSATRQAELTAAIQFPSFALGAAGSLCNPTQPDHGRALELPALDNQFHRHTIYFPICDLNHLLHALHDLEHPARLAVNSAFPATAKTGQQI